MATPSDIIALIDAIDEAVLLVEDERVIAANAAARAMLGRSPLGLDIRFAIRHPAALDHILNQRAGDVEITGLGAPDRPWLVSVRPLGKGRLLVRLADRAAARAAERMRVDFVANASHELRTPLTSILGYAETIADDDTLEPAMTRKFGAIIGTEARRMLRIVEDLLSLSRIEANRFVAPILPVSVHTLITAAIDNAASGFTQRQCTIAMEVEPGLPDIIGDLPQLVQLLDNLIGNALRYGCREAGASVTVRAESVAGQVALSVIDRGDGIAVEHLPRLTERFYRVDDARSRDGGGTGLGLAIVKHIVERHNGTLEIRSTPGSGTSVTVRLPAAAVTKA